MSDICDIHSRTERETGTALPPFSLPGTRSLVLDRKDAGGACRIDIAIPDAPPPDSGWPAVVLLDAAGCFATCVEAVRRMGRRPDATGVSPLVVIGISSVVPDNPRRQHDLTSTRADKTNSGGAPAFLAFIEDQAKPRVAEIVPLDPARQTLFGHSLAGYFTLWVLAHHPEAFRTYAAISPSIWWDPEHLAEALSALSVHDRNLLLCLGAWEDELPPWQRAAPGSADVMARRRARRMVERARALAEQLQPVLGPERVQFRLLPEEDHASVISAAIPRMLRLASLPRATASVSA